MTRRDPPSDPDADPPSDIDRRVCQYVDRLNSGESLDPVEVLAENPIHGQEILDRLERFVGSLAVDTDSNEPLGTLGAYTLRRQIGRGGMGVVYEAWQNSMDRRVALKVMPKAVAIDRKAVRRFILEAQAAGKLSHPNIVHVHGMGVEEQVPYYAMDFVEGETLAQILARLRAAEGKEEERKTILQRISGLLSKGSEEAGAVETKAVEEAEAAERKPLFGSDDFDLAYYSNLGKAFAGVAEGLQHAHSKKVIHRI